MVALVTKSCFERCLDERPPEVLSNLIFLEIMNSEIQGVWNAERC